MALLDPSTTNHVRPQRKFGKYGGTGMNMASILRGAKFAAVVAAALAMAGCAKNNDQNLAGGAAAPGSQQDFRRQCRRSRLLRNQFLGADRSGPRHARQAVAMAQQLQPLFLHRRRPRRRARHARIQYRARRPPRRDRAAISRLARHRGHAHAHHLLRQGAAGCAVQRHFLLVAKPPRRDRARSELVTVAGLDRRSLRNRRRKAPVVFWQSCLCL